MGLFSKKECARCGNKASLLTRKKLADGDYLCGDCVDECSEELTSEDFANMTVDDVDEHIEACEENDERYENEFQTTRTFHTQMVLRNKDIVYVDDNHGWWVNATRRNPDIFSFDQVGGCRLDLDTSLKDSDEREKISMWDHLGAYFGSMQYPGLPVPSPDEEIQSMYFVVNIVGHPYIHEVRIPVMDAIIPSEGDIRGGYEVAYQLMSFFNGRHDARQASSQQADMAAMAASAAASAVAAAQKNAASGGAGTSVGDVADQLIKLKQLVDAGILTQDEFDAKKKQLLGL